MSIQYNSSINAAIKMRMITMAMTELSQGYNNYGNYCTMSIIIGGKKAVWLLEQGRNKRLMYLVFYCLHCCNNNILIFNIMFMAPKMVYCSMI